MGNVGAAFSQPKTSQDKTLSAWFLFRWARRVQCGREVRPDDHHAEAIKKGLKERERMSLLPDLFSSSMDHTMGRIHLPSFLFLFLHKEPQQAKKQCKGALYYSM
jgi:hypothetical protein